MQLIINQKTKIPLPLPAVMKSSIFWDITPCSPSRRFGGACRHHLQGRRISQARHQRESRWQAQLCLPHSLTLKVKVTCSSETSVDFQRTTRRCILEDRSIHNHRCENLKCYLSAVVHKTYYLTWIKFFSLRPRMLIATQVPDSFHLQNWGTKPSAWYVDMILSLPHLRLQRVKLVSLHRFVKDKSV
jgi:hypothetical protein